MLSEAICPMPDAERSARSDSKGAQTCQGLGCFRQKNAQSEFCYSLSNDQRLPKYIK
jgi:hypothetical protein